MDELITSVSSVRTGTGIYAVNFLCVDNLFARLFSSITSNTMLAVDCFFLSLAFLGRPLKLPSTGARLEILLYFRTFPKIKIDS